MELNLTKPIVFLDIEATGLNISEDRIVEIALLKILADKSTQKKHHRFNPGLPMTVSASKVTGINDKDLEAEPEFKEYASSIIEFIGNADLSGFNLLKFDLPILMEELLRLNIDFKLDNRRIIDVQKIFHMMEKRTLEAAYVFYCGKELEGSHSAEVDTQATYEVFLSQIQKYAEFENDIEQVYTQIGKPGSQLVDTAGRMIRDKHGDELFNFGKYKGKRVEDILEKDPSYYSWMMRGDFPQHTKKMLTEIRLRMKKA